MTKDCARRARLLRPQGMAETRKQAMKESIEAPQGSPLAEYEGAQYSHGRPAALEEA